MILCITPNAAIDHTVFVSNFAVGQMFRAARVRTGAGGKGLNVARAILLLGGEPMCAGLLGGHNGRRIAELTEQDGLPAAWTWIEGESRICTIIADAAAGHSTVINEIGPTICPADWDRFQNDLLHTSGQAECVCISGSLTPGITPEQFGHLIAALRQSGRAVWVDTSGAPLQAALTASPTAIKINAEEAGEIVGRAITGADAALAAAQEIRARCGTEYVVITLEGDGAVMSHPEGQWWARPPHLQIVNAVGSGDSFLAGLVLPLTRRQPLPDALRCGVAAGSANAAAGGAGIFQVADYERILAQTIVHSR